MRVKIDYGTYYDDECFTLKDTSNEWKKWTLAYYRTFDDNLPKEYYINEQKKTIVLRWHDDTITKVKTSPDDKFDARFGFLLAYYQKHCGLSKNKANRYLDKIVANKDQK